MNAKHWTTLAAGGLFLALSSIVLAQPTVHTVPRTFTGTISLSGDSNNWSGSLTATNPACVLTVATTPQNVDNGIGPNGGILFNGSSECAGSYELFLSNGTQQFNLPTAGGIGNDTGVYGGTFVIVNTNDGQTVNWAGNYTQVYNINPGGIMGCAGLTFCANLGPAFGTETFNGGGLSFLLELNGFTWNVSGE